MLRGYIDSEMSRALVLGLLLMVAVSVAASDAKRKPRPVKVVEPGALAYDYARDDLLVADRKLNRVVRIDLRSGKRRVAVTGLREPGLRRDMEGQPTERTADQPAGANACTNFPYNPVRQPLTQVRLAGPNSRCQHDGKMDERKREAIVQACL